MQSPTEPTSPTGRDVSLVLVTGSGRSGTSSLAGSLKRLGLHVPQPEVEASETNPRGFYEPRWVIDFHKGYLKQLAMHNIDSRPAAVDRVAELVSSGEPRQRLAEWLAGEVGERRIVVKDPHAFWFADVWTDACADNGIDLTWLTALRHPAEVVGSRDLAYLQSQPDELRLVKETSNVAGWVHAALLTERAGRGHRRAFIGYTDLLEDWRTALGRVVDQLGLEVDADLASTDHHPIDDFVDSSLRKSQLTWDDVSVGEPLRSMAEEVWQLLGGMVHTPDDAVASARLDEIHDTYAAMYLAAAALTYDLTKAESTLAAREAREAQRETMQDLRGKVRSLRTRLEAAQTPAEKGAPAPEGRGLRSRLRRG